VTEPAPGVAPVVRLHHVSKAYGPAAFALRDVSFELRKGEFVFVTGPSGAGKTTLLRLLSAAERPSEGTIEFGGRDIARLRATQIPALRRRVGVVFQEFKLLPRHSVEDNVWIALEVAGFPPREGRAKVFSVLRQLGLHDKRFLAPHELSGGEQQRVALARALVNDPDLLLADEPTGNLDPQLSVEIMDLISAAAARGTGVVVATHDLALVRRYGKRTLHLAGGRVDQDLPAPGRRA
jgi:cell division transport system ATP-binding protein